MSHINYRWIATTKEIYRSIYNNHKNKFCVFETCTDAEGYYGSPCIITSWGFRVSSIPLIRSECYYPNDKDHELWGYFLCVPLECEDCTE
jgi:hypothetical protein